MNRTPIRLITFIIITSLLCQGIAWADGPLSRSFGSRRLQTSSIEPLQPANRCANDNATIKVAATISGRYGTMGLDSLSPSSIFSGERTLQDAFNEGLRYLRENLSDRTTLEDRVIWTGINPSRTATAQTLELANPELLYILISVGKQVFNEVRWGYQTGASSNLPFMKLRDAVNDFLLGNNRQQLSQRLSNTLNRTVDLDKEVEWIWIDRFQEGTDASVFTVTVHLRSMKEVKFGIISAKNAADGNAIVENDRKNLSEVRQLYENFNRSHSNVLPHEVPTVYEGGYGRCTHQGTSGEIYMFMVEWLDNVYEVAPILYGKYLVFCGLKRGENQKYWGTDISRSIRERTVMLAATIFELTGGKVPRIFYGSGDIVADADSPENIHPIYLITIPYFLNDTEGAIVFMAGKKVISAIAKTFGYFNDVPLDNKYLLLLLNLLLYRAPVYTVNERMVPQEQLQTKSFPEPEIVFSGITKALIRMYGEKEGVRRSVSIFEKFSQRETPFKISARDYLNELKKKYGLEKEELRKQLWAIKPNSFERVSVQTLMNQYSLTEEVIIALLEELGFKGTGGNVWKRVREGSQRAVGCSM